MNEVGKDRACNNDGRNSDHSIDVADAYSEKLARLRARLEALDSIAVAFSGGVDSSVLLHAAKDVLGSSAVGVIADSPSLPRSELEQALELADGIGARLRVVSTEELQDPEYVANRGDRCYYCKSALFSAMLPWAERNGFKSLAFGEITDDLLDDRPGARAALEFGVSAPLSESGFSKDDVRRYAREAGLPVASKPSSACLASRIPVGTRVTVQRLARVEAAEEALRALGLRQLRVRDRGSHARVEVGMQELETARRALARIRAALLDVGFESLELDVYHSPGERASGAHGIPGGQC